jgi:hypothetical protein
MDLVTDPKGSQKASPSVGTISKSLSCAVSQFWHLLIRCFELPTSDVNGPKQDELTMKYGLRIYLDSIEYDLTSIREACV